MVARYRIIDGSLKIPAASNVHGLHISAGTDELCSRKSFADSDHAKPGINFVVLVLNCADIWNWRSGRRAHVDKA